MFITLASEVKSTLAAKKTDLIMLETGFFGVIDVYNIGF